MPDVSIPHGRKSIAAYSHLAPGAKRGVVVIHEIFGPQPEINRVVDRFAAAGYAAVAPDMFDGGTILRCIRAAMKAMTAGEGPVIDKLEAAREWLKQEAGLESDAIGLIGFCLGGGFALAAGSGWGAVSCNYGAVPKTRVMEGIGPVIGCYGGRDRSMRGFDRRLDERLTKLGVEHEVHLLPEAGHSFLTDGHHPIAATLGRPLMHIEWNPKVAEEGWTKILGFFDKHL